MAIGHPSLSPPDGFEAPDVDLPQERVDVPIDRRLDAALLVTAISMLECPEDCVGGVRSDVAEAFESDTLVQLEALTFVDMLVDLLTPRAGSA